MLNTFRARGSQVLLIAIALLLAANAYLMWSPGATVSAQSGFWKVVSFTPGERGAARLEAELNRDSWELHSLHLSTIQGAEAIAVLKRR